MTCLLCGEPLGAAQFITRFNSRRTGKVFPLHILCKQNILDQPLLSLSTGTVFDYGIRPAPTLAELQAWNFKLNQGIARTQAQDLLRS